MCKAIQLWGPAVAVLLAAGAGLAAVQGEAPVSVLGLSDWQLQEKGGVVSLANFEHAGVSPPRRSPCGTASLHATAFAPQAQVRITPA